MTTCLHVGDLHFWGYSKNPLVYLGKRALGSANLLLKRSRAFRIELAPQLAARLQGECPSAQHLLLSGDFSTTSLPIEFASASEAFLHLLPQGLQAHVVPGNHDRYTGADHRKKPFEEHLIQRLAPAQKPFPFVEILAPGVACVGLDATTRNGLLGSHGLLKPADLLMLESWWAEHGSSILQLIILCHFPPEAPLDLIHRDRGQQLRGGEALVQWISRLNIPVLFCHGHYHQRWLWRSPVTENLVYLNAGAPLMRKKQTPPDLGYFRFEATPHVERVTLVRCLDLGDAASWEERTVELPSGNEPIDLRAKVFL